MQTIEAVVAAVDSLNGWTTSEAMVLRVDGEDLAEGGETITVHNHSLDANAPSGAFGIAMWLAGRWLWLWLDCTGSDGSDSSVGESGASGPLMGV